MAKVSLADAGRRWAEEIQTHPVKKKATPVHVCDDGTKIAGRHLSSRSKILLKNRAFRSMV